MKQDIVNKYAKRVSNLNIMLPLILDAFWSLCSLDKKIQKFDRTYANIRKRTKTRTQSHIKKHKQTNTNVHVHKQMNIYI